jgi:uncharacterized protein
MTPVDTVGISIEQATGAPLVLLGEHDEPYRVLPILIGGLQATAVVAALQGAAPPRLLRFDFMAAIVDSVGAHVEKVEINELREGTFSAELAVAGPAGERRIDTRPSDAIALAARVGTHVFVSDDVLDEAGVVLLAESGDGVVDEDDVEKFRAFIADLDPPTSPTAEAAKAVPGGLLWRCRVRALWSLGGARTVPRRARREGA